MRLRRHKVDPYWGPKPPPPAFDDAVGQARYSLHPLVTIEEWKAYERERRAVRTPVTALVCGYCGADFPVSAYADDTHPLYPEDLDALWEENRYAHGCPCWEFFPDE